MKCQSQTSKYCEKNVPKKKIKYIGGLLVCGNCYWKIKQIKRGRNTKKN